MSGIEYGAKETSITDYRQRTEANVRDSDATVWLGSIGSPGWKETSWATRGLNKELFHVVPGKGVRPSDVAGWIISSRVKVLNVAGNRESKAPGIGERTEWFLITAFRMVLNLPERPPPEIQGRGWTPEPY